MSVENILEEMDLLIENATVLPLSNGKILVDAEKMRQMIEDIRLNLPRDIQSAHSIVADRTKIIETARKEAEGVLRQAEERARLMVAKDVITKSAQDKSAELLNQSRAKATEIRKAANVYVDDLMQRTDESIATALSELRKARQDLKASQRIGTEK